MTLTSLIPTRPAPVITLLTALLLSLPGVSPAAAQPVVRPPAAPLPAVRPMPGQAPQPPAPAPFVVPPLRMETPPPPPIPPVGPYTFGFDVDGIVDSAWQAAEWAVGNLDLDAIREGAQRAAESAKSFAFTYTPGPDAFAFASPPQWRAGIGDRQADMLYRSARNLIDRARYDKAVEQLDRLIGMSGAGNIDAALYWKAYAQARLAQRTEALATLADLQKRFADSRWLKDAKALEVEVRQASGQPVSPDAQNDEDLKLLALRGIMQSDPDRAVPMIERLLAGNGSVRLQENALFVLAQSRSPRARQIITGIAKGASNPDVQLRAVRYLGIMGTAENLEVLDDVYRSSSDTAIRRAVLQAFMMAGAADKLIDVAKTERDHELRRTAILSLGMSGAGKASEALQSIYASESDADVRREIVNALFLHHNAAALVALARGEKDPALKKDIVTKLSLMKSKEATEYLLELLK